MISAVEAKILANNSGITENLLKSIENNIVEVARNGAYSTCFNAKGVADYVVNSIIAKLLVNGYDVTYDAYYKKLNINWR